MRYFLLLALLLALLFSMGCQAGPALTQASVDLADAQTVLNQHAEAVTTQPGGEKIAKVEKQIAEGAGKAAAVAGAVAPVADAVGKAIATEDRAERDLQIIKAIGEVAKATHTIAPGTPADTYANTAAVVATAIVSLISIFAHKKTASTAITTPGTTEKQ